MNKRTPEQWRKLFAAHQASGLNQAQFCKEHKLCPKYFSLRRRQLNAPSPPATKHTTPLIQVQPPRPASYMGVSLHYQGIEIRLPQADPQFIANVVKQLA